MFNKGVGEFEEVFVGVGKVNRQEGIQVRKLDA